MNDSTDDALREVELGFKELDKLAKYFRGSEVVMQQYGFDFMHIYEALAAAKAVLMGYKRLHEDFNRLPQFTEEIKAAAEKLEKTPRKRHALAGVRFDVSSSALSMESEGSENINTTELESLILAHIPHKRKVISQKCRALLNTEVVVNGETWDSPEKLWATQPGFKSWAEQQLKSLSKNPNANIDQACYWLRMYGDKTYGFIDRLINTTPKQSEPETLDLNYGDL